MKLPSFALPAWGPRVWTVLGMIVLVAFLAWAIPAGCQRRASQRAQERVEDAQAGAAANSAADAIATVQRSGEASAASEDLTRANDREIRAADGADARVGSGVNTAGRSALCRREAYRNDPKCRGAGK